MVGLESGISSHQPMQVSLELNKMGFTFGIMKQIEKTHLPAFSKGNDKALSSLKLMLKHSNLVQ